MELFPESLADAMKGRLLFAIPKKGRLHEQTLKVLAGADIRFSRTHRLDVCLIANHPMALLFLPASDIPRFVGRGNVDMGITGQDQILESRTQSVVTELVNLEFGTCKLQVQAPQNGPYQTVESLAGKRIVTSYVVLAQEYFREVDERVGLRPGEGTRIEHVSGSVETACALGLADGIVDLVESGETMRAAGLHPLSTLLQTSAVLIRSTTPKHPSLEPLIAKIASRIAGFVASNKYVVCQYNVHRDLLPTCLPITPGRRAATISSIDDEGWCAVSAMVEKKKSAVVMDDLVAIGAEDVFLLALDNCRV